MTRLRRPRLDRPKPPECSRRNLITARVLFKWSPCGFLSRCSWINHATAAVTSQLIYSAYALRGNAALRPEGFSCTRHQPRTDSQPPELPTQRREELIVGSQRSRGWVWNLRPQTERKPDTGTLYWWRRVLSAWCVEKISDCGCGEKISHWTLKEFHRIPKEFHQIPNVPHHIPRNPIRSY